MSESMVTVFQSGNHDGEMEATTVLGLLESNGIPAILSGPGTIPSLEFQVQVPEERLAEAQRTIADAKAGGPLAAMEAEAETEL